LEYGRFFLICLLPCREIALIAFCAAANYTQGEFLRRIGALLTINIIFEVQLFAGGLVVKIAAYM